MLKKQVVALAEADDDINWDAQIDSTVVQVHQHAVGARKRGSTVTNRGAPRLCPLSGRCWPPRSPR
jgi:hypothetical protein